VIGGEISNSSMVVPLNGDKLFENNTQDEDGDGPGAPNASSVDPYITIGPEGKFAHFINGQTCNQQPSEVQVFVYRFDSATKTYKQTKIDHPEKFAISGHSEVPPGDCVIMEFGPVKDRTDKLCQQYGIRDKDRCEQFGVRPDERSICVDREVR
jgi:hypothetical protein